MTRFGVDNDNAFVIVISIVGAGVVCVGVDGIVAEGAAAGGYADIAAAAKKMARLRDTVYKPNKEEHAAYDKLYAIYRRLHDLFGRASGDAAMKELNAIRRSFHS